jgi:hypothetical protein
MPAKVYDRPERQGLSPVLILVAVLVLVLIGYGIYRWQFAAPAAQPTDNAPTRGQSSLNLGRHHFAAMARHPSESVSL